MPQRVGRGIVLLNHYHGTGTGCEVSNTNRSHFTPRIDLVPILEEGGWFRWPVWTDGKTRPHRDSIPERPDRSQSLCLLSYPAHTHIYIYIYIYIYCVAYEKLGNVRKDRKICGSFAPLLCLMLYS